MQLSGLTRPTTLNSERLFGQVAHLLAVAIISGRYQAGDLLPNEEDLKSEISVSRTAYREAVKVLTAKGLVESRPKSGTRVGPRDGWNLLDPDVLGWHFAADPNEKFIRDLFELRRFIEPTAARLAAIRRTDADLARIDAAFRGMETNPPYMEAAIRADLAFHDAIFAAAHNDAVRCLANVVASTVQWSMRIQSVKDKSDFVVALSDHRRVRDAIAVGNSDLAAAHMSALVLDSLDDTLSILARLSTSKEKHE
jgi:DNA-binding FadR family transcriptional regulator